MHLEKLNSSISSSTSWPASVCCLNICSLCRGILAGACATAVTISATIRAVAVFVITGRAALVSSLCLSPSRLLSPPPLWLLAPAHCTAYCTFIKLNHLLIDRRVSIQHYFIKMRSRLTEICWRAHCVSSQSKDRIR
jgi:hypothetical protein